MDKCTFEGNCFYKSFKKECTRDEDLENCTYIIEDKEEYKIKEGQPSCYQCHNECKEIYQIKVIDEAGQMTFEKVCSEECALEVKQELYILHKNRSDDVKNCTIQRLS